MTAAPRRVTLREVAAELEVSAKTVSNAYTRPDQLSDRRRTQILATAARLGYPGPDPLAAGLRRGRVGAIGLAYANRLSSAFEVAGSVVLLAATSVRRLPLVVSDHPGPAHFEELGGGQAPWVGIDDRAAARAAAEHLLAFGHRRLAVVSFALRRSPIRGLVDERAQQSATYAVTRRRLAGYRAAAIKGGLDWAQVPVAQGISSTIAEGEAGAAAVLATTPRPTALLCLSDRLAEGALLTAHRLGLRVPDDLSVIGFDDATPAARLDLTTIRQTSRRH